MPCKFHSSRHGETCRTNSSNTRRSRYACIIEAHESTRTRTGKTEARDHRDLIAEKGSNSLTHCSLVHKPDTHTACDENSRCESRSFTESVRSCKKNTGMASEESQKQKRGQWEGTQMDFCHLENSEMEQQFQTYKGRVVLRGDVVKDNSGSYAVLTDQISSASQLTAAKVLDVIALLPGCWSSKRRRIFLHPSQNESCSNTNETF